MATVSALNASVQDSQFYRYPLLRLSILGKSSGVWQDPTAPLGWFGPGNLNVGPGSASSEPKRCRIQVVIEVLLMLLGIDLGTGSVKALLLSTQGEILAEASQPYTVAAPQPGWAETNPQDWWQGVAIAVHKALAGTSEPVEAIGLSGQMHGVVLTDSACQPLRNAILWADNRSSKTLATYQVLPSDLRHGLGNPITAGMAGLTLLWLRDHEPDHYQAARWALQPKDWLRSQLTGQVAAEPSDASGTLLYDVFADQWAEGAIAALQLRPELLPPLMASSAVAGELTPIAAEQLGLAAGIPVVAGAADTACGALGNGLWAPGIFQLTVGTGAQIVTLHDQPQVDAQYRTHLFRTALPHQWYSLAAIQNAGITLEWVRQILGLSWPEVYQDAFQVPVGCEGLTFLPYLTGDRTPHLDPNARGAWAGLDRHHTRGHLMRAALEGVAFSLRQGLEALESTGVKASRLNLAGGGTVEKVWQQLLAEVLGVPLYQSAVTSVSARGAAILAGLGVGVYEDGEAIGRLTPSPTLAASPQAPGPDLVAAWQRYQRLYPQLRDWSQRN